MKVTEVITTFNRGLLLSRNFDRLRHLTKPDEILVIDDGGTDNTKQVCDSFSDLPIHYIYNNNPGQTLCSLARNIGFKNASYDHVVICEPELIFLTDVIQQLKELRPQYPNDIISSGTIYFAPKGRNITSDWEQFEKAGDYTPPTTFQKAIGWVAPYVGLWYKPWVMELGGYDEQFPGAWGWDDIDLLTRLRINNHGQHIALEIKAIHQFHGLGGDKNFVNEGHFKGKSFQGGHEDNHDDLIANKGIEWGKIRT